MKIVFYTPDLTHLRYYMPLALSFKDHDIVFFYIKENAKYNGLSLNDNFEKFKCIIKEFTATDNVSDLSQIDVLFTVESISDKRFLNLREKAKKHIVIAHGFDCIDHSKKLKDCTYLIPFEKSKRIIGDINLDIKVLDVPIPFLYDFDEKVEDKSIFIFYPDAGQTDFCKKLITSLKSDRFNVTVKQRKKHQSIDNVECDCKIYDNVWWPSEALSGPINSSLTIGFGSTAYTDLALAGLRYVDIYNNNIDVFPWNRFEFPDVKNYLKLISPSIDETLQSINDMLKVDVKLPTTQQKEQQVNKIIMWMQ